MLNRKHIGQLGEDIACEELIKGKFKILKRNYREGFDEIDIIARSFNGILVFIEVKTIQMYPMTTLKAEDNMTKDKFFKIKRGCIIFSAKHPELVKNGWRIDLIAITLIDDIFAKLNHYENISL